VAALDFAHIAAGRADGFWEFGLSPWDIAAGTLLVKEAGGMVTDMDRSPIDLNRPRVLASNKQIHVQMADILSDLLS
jgi:myo-inositol-1(or 4)-monophosphatase